LLGPPGWSMPVCEMDVRVGGRYRWRWRSDENASEFGFSGTFREVQVQRSFRAPRALVYRAFTEPELVRRWLLGPPGWSMPVCEMDVRVGGQYRWRWRSDENASEFGFTGTFREVQAPSKLVHSEAYDPGTLDDDFPPNDALVTVTFEENGGITTVTTRIDFGSKDAREAATSTGMTDGMEQSYQGLDRLLDEQSSR
jgi:uncharacterized protein YndB with AHSA1/START domain